MAADNAYNSVGFSYDSGATKLEEKKAEEAVSEKERLEEPFVCPFEIPEGITTVILTFLLLAHALSLICIFIFIVIYLFLFCCSRVPKRCI